MACDTELVLATTRTNLCMKGIGKKVCVTAKENMNTALTNSKNLKVKRRNKKQTTMLLNSLQEKNKFSTISKSMEPLMKCFGISQEIRKTSSLTRISWKISSSGIELVTSKKKKREYCN